MGGMPKLENFIELLQAQIANLDFEGKRQVLDMLGIKVWIDNHRVEVIGTIDEVCVTALPQSGLRY